MLSVHVLGYIAAFVTTTIYIPQALKTRRLKHTKGIAHSTYYLAVSASTLWLTYGLLIRDIPLIISNSIVLCTALFTLYFLLKHR